MINAKKKIQVFFLNNMQINSSYKKYIIFMNLSIESINYLINKLQIFDIFEIFITLISFS